MDSKKSPTRRSTKRNSNKVEDNDWDCSVCTYKNTPEAFKCLMCDVRKGTSTRKPRLNPALAAQQAATLPAGTSAPLNGIPPSNKAQKSQKNKHKYKKHTPRLMNVDRSTAQTREVTVNSVTVVITEYRPKVATSNSNHNNRRASSEYSFISESTDSRS